MEFDDVEWKKREWFRVHDVFQVFLVEHTLVWTRRPTSEGEPPPLPFPALVSVNTLLLYPVKNPPALNNLAPVAVILVIVCTAASL